MTMKLVVGEKVRHALMASEQSESILALHASWSSYKMFPGPSELTVLQQACQLVQREYNTTCRVHFGSTLDT